MVADAIRDCRELYRDLLAIGQSAGVIRSDLDVESAASLILGLSDGLSIQMALAPDMPDPDRLNDAVAEIILRFIEGDPSADPSPALLAISQLLETRSSEGDDADERS